MRGRRVRRQLVTIPTASCDDSSPFRILSSLAAVPACVHYYGMSRLHELEWIGHARQAWAADGEQ